MAPLNIAIIGLGQRSRKRAVQAIHNTSDIWRLVAACDTNDAARKSFAILYPHLPIFEDVVHLIQWHQQSANAQLGCAYVAVPHHLYSEVVIPLLKAKIHILKEKPAALNPAELDVFQSLGRSNSVRVEIASQRRYGSHMIKMKEWIPFVGTIHTVEATRKISVTNLGEGWRARTALAGGGTMGDIGWHILDQVLCLVGDGSVPNVAYSKMFHIRTYQGHDCEDSASVILDIPHISTHGEPQTISAHLLVSRIGHEEVENIIITGEDGVLSSNGVEIGLQLSFASGKRSFSSCESFSNSDFERMLKAFHAEVTLSSPSMTYYQHSSQDLLVTQTLQNIYRSVVPACQELSKPIQGALTRIEQKDSQLGRKRNKKMQWPIIDAGVEQAVINQLHEDVSIYGAGGVFELFETEFKTIHDMPMAFSLLHNSGTNALHALYFAADFQPGDEVIFPVYTFHATCSPAMHFGIKPIFCETLDNGNISPAAIEAAITHKTKAVVLTHMWGIPCDMTTICSILQNRKDILLFEDCSHAHGGRLNGKALGTFGDGAVWSLQGQKIVTGGEGGITLTKNAEFHYRQLLWGHYNKRCKVEIPVDHPLRSYSLTGAGLKSRAHPLAIAIALNQLRKLREFHKYKSHYAQQLAKGLESMRFLEMPSVGFYPDGYSEPAWYAFVVRFKPSHAPKGLDRKTFVGDLLSHGLGDVDIPESTGLLHKEPLFNLPETILPHLYTQGSMASLKRNNSFDHAQSFYDEAIKLPVYATADDQAITDHYVQTIHAVAHKWVDRDAKTIK